MQVACFYGITNNFVCPKKKWISWLDEICAFE